MSQRALSISISRICRREGSQRNAPLTRLNSVCWPVSESNSKPFRMSLGTLSQAKPHILSSIQLGWAWLWSVEVALLPVWLTTYMANIWVSLSFLLSLPSFRTDTNDDFSLSLSFPSWFQGCSIEFPSITLVLAKTCLLHSPKDPNSAQDLPLGA
jgi:hypothetical protein